MSFYEAGKYRATVAAQGFSESKEKKTPFFFLTITPNILIAQDGTETDAPASQFDSIVRCYLTPKTMERFTDNLKALGFSGNQPADLSPEKPGFHDFTGQQIEVICKHEEYNGNQQDKWELPSGGQSAAMPPTDLRDINARFGGEFKTAFGSGKPAAAPAHQKLDPQDGDPDIPF